MAFESRNLSVLAYANGFTLWHYKDHKEPLHIVCAADYFTDVGTLLVGGDLIVIRAVDGATIRMVTDSGGDTVKTQALA